MFPVILMIGNTLTGKDSTDLGLHTTHLKKFKAFQKVGGSTMLGVQLLGREEQSTIAMATVQTLLCGQAAPMEWASILMESIRIMSTHISFLQNIEFLMMQRLD